MAVGGYFPTLYNSAVRQGAEDYDSLKNQYGNLTESVRSNPTKLLSFFPITPQLRNYSQGPDYSYVRDLADTGGYSANDISSLRERAVSPVRSIYDAAKRDANRRLNLQGGYSPNFGAIMAKLAREQSNLAGQRLNDVNANLAQMTQAGKLAGAQILAPLDAEEQRRRDEIEAYNTNEINETNRMNQEMALNFANYNKQAQDSDFEKILSGIRGQESVYSTPSALTSQFGNQVLQASQIASQLPSVGRASTINNPYSPFRDVSPVAGIGYARG